MSGKPIEVANMSVPALGRATFSVFLQCPTPDNTALMDALIEQQNDDQTWSVRTGAINVTGDFSAPVNPISLQAAAVTNDNFDAGNHPVRFRVTATKPIPVVLSVAVPVGA